MHHYEKLWHNLMRVSLGHLAPRKDGKQLGLLVLRKWLEVFVLGRGCIFSPCSRVTFGQGLR